jgi:hypothetical protein
MSSSAPAGDGVGGATLGTGGVDVNQGGGGGGQRRVHRGVEERAGGQPRPCEAAARGAGPGARRAEAGAVAA